jgi:outer membrane autotransporter protein
MVPALLAMGLMGALPDWVSIAQAQGYYLAPGDAMARNANVLTTALVNKSAISSAIGNRSQGGSRSTAGRFRIDGIRMGGGEFDGTAAFSEDSAAGETATGQLGGFLSAVGGFGDQEGVLDYTNGGLIGGVDYQFSEALMGGLSINWINTNTNYAGQAGGSERNSYGASLYAGYSVDSLHIDGLFNYSFSDYDMTRGASNIVGPPAIPATTVRGVTNSDEIFLSAGVVYDLELAGWTLGPAARVDLVKVWMDGYSETGGGAGQNAQYNAFDVTSFTTDLGGEASYAITTSAGVITPTVRAYWVHEYQNDAQVLTGTLIGGGAFFTQLALPDRNYYRVGAGATMELQNGVEIYVDYEALVGFNNFSSNQFAVGGRFEF